MSSFYYPHMHYKGVLFMGMNRELPCQWIEPNTNLLAVLEHKKRQYHDDPSRVYRAESGSYNAQMEFADLLEQHLIQDHHQDYYQQQNGMYYQPEYKLACVGDQPLWNCSQWVADDCLIMQESNGSYYLTAASLCSPSHWSLDEKIGQPIRFIHDPIPHFHEALSDKIDRFFNHLRPEHIITRYNWSLQSDNHLACYPDAQPTTLLDADTALYYRYERQSLRRLPKTGAIAFTIRIHLQPLEQLWLHPEAMPQLFEAIEKTSSALAEYKGFTRMALALEKYRHVESADG